MSTIDQEQPFGDSFEAPKSEVSMLALAAFMVSILICIPIAPPLGVILGMIALVRLMGNPTVRGRGLAIAAIVLGLCFSIGLGVGGFVLYTKISAVTQFMNNGPPDAMEAGFDGDIDGFLSTFSAPHSPDAAREFLDELRDRYGVFESMIPMNVPGGAGASPDDDRAVFPMRYRAEFSSGAVEFEVELLLGTSEGLTQKIESIRVLDRQRPSLRFPALPPPPTGANFGNSRGERDAAGDFGDRDQP